MNVNLTPELARWVEAKVASGRYPSASEVVREALRRLAASERPRAERIVELRRKISEGMADSRAGRIVDGETAIHLRQARLRKADKSRRSR
jgi:antitoxin ParD1/3/4